VVLFVMLAGYLPFDDPNMNALFNKIERGEYRMARHFSDSAKDIIGKMMTVDPTQRIKMDEIIAHPWFQVGFDPKMLARASPSKVVAVSKEEVDNAVTRVEERKETKSSGQPGAAGGTTNGCDAFDLISRITSGSLNPLVASQQGVVKSSTRFLLHGDHSDVMQVLESLKANPKMKEGSLEIKGFVNASKGLLTYLAIVIPTVVPKLSFVELRRSRGDIFEFHELFKQLTLGLGTKIRAE